MEFRGLTGRSLKISLHATVLQQEELNVFLKIHLGISGLVILMEEFHVSTDSKFEQVAFDSLNLTGDITNIAQIKR